MAEFTRYENYMLLNQAKPLWLVGIDLSEENLWRIDLAKANLRFANLSNADLQGANMYGADLRNADLKTALLIGADLSSANLVRADLRYANVGSNTNFDRAIYNRDTQWPVGFDPQAAGAQLVL